MFNIGYSLLPIRKLEGLHCHSLHSSGITQNITVIEWCNHCSCSTRFIFPSVSNWHLCSNRLLLLFLCYVALECCARLPGTLGKKERMSSSAIVNSASTSACTASSCASAGFSGIARGPLTVQVRSRHRLSSLPAFALQKKSGLLQVNTR